MCAVSSVVCVVRLCNVSLVVCDACVLFVVCGVHVVCGLCHMWVFLMCVFWSMCCVCCIFVFVVSVVSSVCCVFVQCIWAECAVCGVWHMWHMAVSELCGVSCVCCLCVSSVVCGEASVSDVLCLWRVHHLYWVCCLYLCVRFLLCVWCT